MEVERVEALSYGGLRELPAQFIRPAHERPENSKAVEGVTVPVVSLSSRTMWWWKKYSRLVVNGDFSSSPITGSSHR